jgi:hypothetical protein
MALYTKLTSRQRRLGGYTQLWLAPDHLLLVNSTRFAENYKRFSLADIQSIVVTELPSRIVLQVILIFAALSWFAFSFTVDFRFTKWFIEFTGAIALLTAIVDIARGPRCRCVLHTRVSAERLEPVSRLRIAKKFVAALRSRIEAVQGVLPMEELAVPDATPWEPPPPELIANPGYVPEALFGTFLVTALAIWASVLFPKVTDITGLIISLMFAEVVLVIVCLVRRRGRDGRVIIYVVVLLSILGLLFDATTVVRGAGTWYFTMVTRAASGNGTVQALSIFPSGNRSQIYAASWRAALGIIGLAAAFWERKRPS